MDFGQAIAAGFRNYANFFGRAGRSEFWFWILFAFLGTIVAEILDAVIFVYHAGLSPLNTLFSIVMLLPSLAVMVRRLHDTGRSGWWLLLVPTVIGIFVLLYWASFEGTPGENKYDPVAAAGYMAYERRTLFRLAVLKRADQKGE
jgi:uncharacterized membrane protein YhaH (DUF805 family)